jgi:ubiquinone/menaquinone biosynthesis C-methylase UbiE
MPNRDEMRRLAEASGDPFTPESPYFASVEQYTARAWQSAIWPRIQNQDLTRVIDLAAGHGRHTEQLLLRGASEVFVLDIQPGNIDICRRRFANEARVRFGVTSGYDFSPVPDGWATFVFCYDAMVHFDSDVVRAYLQDCKRVLPSGTTGFFHHSNTTDDSIPWGQTRHARNFMSASLFRHYAVKEGLEVVTQEVIDWGGVAQLDCLSLVRRK